MLDFSNTNYWKPIPEAPVYVCNPTGVIFNSKTGRELHSKLNNGKHPQVAMRNEAGAWVLLQRNHIVAKLFMPNYDPDLEISFRNGDTEDISVDNLIQEGRGRRGPRRAHP